MHCTHFSKPFAFRNIVRTRPFISIILSNVRNIILACKSWSCGITLNVTVSWEESITDRQTSSSTWYLKPLKLCWLAPINTASAPVARLEINCSSFLEVFVTISLLLLFTIGVDNDDAALTKSNKRCTTVSSKGTEVRCVMNIKSNDKPNKCNCKQSIRLTMFAVEIEHFVSNKGKITISIKPHDAKPSE